MYEDAQNRYKDEAKGSFWYMELKENKMEELGERINVLEGYIAEQDKTIQELSDVLAEQWQVIEKLTKRLERSERMVEEIVSGQDDRAGTTVLLP